jgi:hypothetical protein
MRWLRFPPVLVAVVLVGLALAGPAAAQPDHLHLDLALVGCGQVKVTGFELPKHTRLDVRFQNAAGGATLARETVTTKADGSLSLDAKLALTGVRTLRATVARPGAAKPFVFSELSISGECPLPFTGPARAPLTAGLGLSLVAVGAILVGVSLYRGRDTAGRVVGPRP